MSTEPELLEKLRTARELVNWGCQYFEDSGLHYGHGSDNPLDEALAIVRHAAAISWEADEAAYDKDLDLLKRQKTLQLFTERVETRRPTAYLTNEAWFAGLPFFVNEDVLIPRSPFAELIERRFEPWLGGKAPARVLDLCTGSACIAIACAYAFPDARVDATDLSEAALSIAQRNVTTHGLEERVQLFSADVFSGLPVATYELIVSNPPYVSHDEMLTLPPEFDHEPRMALEAENDGLAIVERMLNGAAEYLSEHGLLIVEVGNSQHAVIDRWPDLPIIWLDFERGGDGVFIIDASTLRAWLEEQRSDKAPGNHVG